jgi:RNA polymerase sigma-70 factor (ECF subfamily)
MAREGRKQRLGKAGRSALIEAYLDRRADLVRFFTLRLRSDAAAEDLVQEIYVRLARVADDAPIENAAAYLYRLGSNLMLEQIRGQRRSTARDTAWGETQTMSLGQEQVADEAAADDAVAARQRLAAVVRAVGELPPRTQDVFRLHKLEGLSHAETAARLGISKSAVEKHMIAVLKHLALRLADNPHADRGGSSGSAASSNRRRASDDRGNG